MKTLRISDFIMLIFCSVISYIALSLLFGLSMIMKQKTLTPELLLNVSLHNPQIFLSLLLSLLLGSLLWLIMGNHHTLDVSRQRAGNGQYGTARFMTQTEKNKAYPFVSSGKEKKPGFVVEYSEHGWRVDTSDQSMLMISPPGGGKTTCVMESTIKYNAEVNRKTSGKGASMLITDAKGKLKAEMGKSLLESGYAVFALDFRYPLQSYHYNLMNNVNLSMDKSLAAANAETRILEQAKAEKYAKVLASSIVRNTSVSAASTNESTSYFNETSEGLLTAIILLVSEFGRGSERHIVSVFRLIIELNGLSEESTETLQKNRLEELFNILPEEHRARLFAGPSSKADVRTSMNIFSSALGKLVSFIDNELEQLICEHSPELNAEDFVRRPTAIFLIVPDEDTTKHFFASLYIRNMMNELIAIAEGQPGQVLPRPVLCEWDEFGQIPPIKDFDVLVTAARSRGLRFMIALQSLSQLDNRYSPAQSKIIRQALQMTLFSFQSPNALDTAKEYSKVLGNYTTQSGSVSRGDRNDSHSVQMIGRALMTEDELINLSFGQWLLIKSGHHPAVTKLPPYSTIFKDDLGQVTVPEQAHVKTVYYLTEEKIRRRAQTLYTIKPGQFDKEY
jgi:type IV secretion system protein VirD4